jgi:hypothetical protein
VRWHAAGACVMNGTQLCGTPLQASTTMHILPELLLQAFVERLSRRAAIRSPMAPRRVGATVEPCAQLAVRTSTRGAHFELCADS